MQEFFFSDLKACAGTSTQWTRGLVNLGIEIDIKSVFMWAS